MQIELNILVELISNLSFQRWDHRSFIEIKSFFLKQLRLLTLLIPCLKRENILQIDSKEA